MTRHLMLVPSPGCPAGCAYCFGPRSAGPAMTPETLEAVAGWLEALGDTAPLDITFHGGEPLVAGADFYRRALPALRMALAPRRARFALQSNLWLLSDELAALFAEHRVPVGTSLDGPEEINDAQRGAGYFERTMHGIAVVRRHGLMTGCICTFTAASAPHAGRIFDFFLDQNLDFSVHAAVPSLARPQPDGWTLPPTAFGDLLVDLVDRYLPQAHRIRISTLDAMIRSLSAGRGAICTFGECLGDYLAIGPTGDIYPCQRLAGQTGYALGNVRECPSWDALAAAPAWGLLAERQERVGRECGGCSHFARCHGGCPYVALVAGAAASGGRPFAAGLRDPYCPAYRRAFDHIGERALAEVFAEANMAALAAEGPARDGLLRKGRLLEIMRDAPHPRRAAANARRLVAAAALGAAMREEAACGTAIRGREKRGGATPGQAEGIEVALARLEAAGLVTDPATARLSLQSLAAELGRPAQGLRNAYLHVTYACNLACRHCYASAGPGRTPEGMALIDLERLLLELAACGFEKLVITGGEPLSHPRRERLLALLAGMRPDVRPARIVLRTNLALDLDGRLAAALWAAADQVVVSVDGVEATHDAQRGAGAYRKMISALRVLRAMEPSRTDGQAAACGSQAELPDGGDRLILAATLSAGLTPLRTDGEDAHWVRALAREIGAGVRVKAVLPLGRAAGQAPKEAHAWAEPGCAAVAGGAAPRSSCGLGMNLYVGPDGECYPCHALMHERHALGNALCDGLEAVMARNEAYRHVTVDSNERCRSCDLRYVCGGFCRAWGQPVDPDAAPGDCSALRGRAESLLGGALDVLGVPPERWSAAELPACATQ